MTERIIVLLDMDCFYVQVEEREAPEIKGKPAAVVQYNTWKGGGIIAVNYEARSFGVKRGMRGDEAKEKCPSIHLFQVPVQRGKADLTKYRNAGKEVVSVLCTFSDCVERASIDEAYIEFTKIVEEKQLSFGEKNVQAEDLPSTWVVGYDEDVDGDPSQTTRHEGLSNWLNETSDTTSEEDVSNILKLSVVAEICEEMRRKVYEETGFRCSAGISNNKMLAKLACGLHKPNQQTILPLDAVSILWEKMPVGKVRNLGGKLGDSLSSDFGCKTMGDLSKLTLNQLRSKYDDKTANWLVSLGRGIDSEGVTSRQLPKSIGCGKNFNGKDILNTKPKVNTWMKSLADELSERLLEDQISNSRTAKTLSVHIRIESEEKPLMSRSSYLPSYKAETITKVALGLISNANSAPSKEEKWDPPIRNISLSASKFESLIVEGTTKIKDIFKKIDPSTSRTNLTKIDSPNPKEECINEIDSISDTHNKTLISDVQCKTSISERHNKSSKQKENSGKNLQKSFFLQFLSQNSSDKVRKKYIAKSVASNADVETDVSQNVLEVDEQIDQSDDEQYNRSTDVDEDQEKEETTNVEVIDVSSASSSPILISKRLNSSTSQLRNSASTSKGNTIEESECVSVQEIFPDLDNVDWTVADMLPPILRDKVYEEVEKHKRLNESSEVNEQPNLSSSSINDLTAINSRASSNDNFTFCRECNRKILTVNFVEHSDFHYATELRKQQMVEARSSLVAESRKRESIKNSPNKNNRKKQKNLTTNEMPKIENYFKRK